MVLQLFSWPKPKCKYVYDIIPKLIHINEAEVHIIYSMFTQYEHIFLLAHWGRVTHICVGNLTNIGSDNGLSPGRRQAIIWINAGILLIRTLGTNFSEILGNIHSFSFKNMHLKMSSAKGRLFSLGLNELTVLWSMINYMLPVSLPCMHANNSIRGNARNNDVGS